MSDDTLETIQAPPGGWKLDYQRDKILDPENEQAIELYRAAGDIRKILSNSELKRYQKRLKEITKHLESNGILDLLNEYERLDNEIKELKAQRYELIKQQQAGTRPEREIKSDLAILKENYLSIRQDKDALTVRLKPHVRLIQTRRKLIQRIDEHTAAIKDEEVNRQNRLALDKEARAVGEIIIRTMNGLDFCFRTTKNGQTRVHSIKFERVIVTPDTLQYKIAVSLRGLFGGIRNLVPQGVNLPEAMKRSTVLEQVSSATEMVVSCPQVESGNWHEGVWLVVQRNGLRDGLKERVLYRDYIKRYPIDNKERLPVPTGLKEGMWTGWTYLTEQPHLIITGQNGSGKTNSMLAWISTLITNHSPDEIRFVMIDLKEGVDLHTFRGIPHLLGDVIEDAKTASDWIVALEGLRAVRMNELKRAGERNINAFNKRHPAHKMPHVAVVVDEFGAFAAGANRAYGRVVHNYAAQLAMKARAAGIHLIIGAQTPYKQHIPPDVRDNVTFRLNGRQGSMFGAVSSGGSKDAYELPKIPGRFLVQDGADTYPCQMPYITDEEIEDAIRAARSWGLPTIQIEGLSDATKPEQIYKPVELPQKVFDVDEFLSICINILDGSINYRDVWEIAKSEFDVSLSQCKAIADDIKELSMLEFGEKTYELVTQGRGKRLAEIEIMQVNSQDIPVKVELSMNYALNNHEVEL